MTGSPTTPTIPAPTPNPPDQRDPPHQKTQPRPTPQPDHHPPPERAPGQERKPDQEQRPRQRTRPSARAPPGVIPHRNRLPRQRHPRPRRTPQPPRTRRPPAADEVGDRDTSVRAEADAVPEGEVAPDDVGAGGKAEQDLGSPRESRPDDLPEREDETTDQTEVSDALEKTETGSPDTDAALPVHDRTLPLTDKEWSEHVTEVRDALDKARAAGLRVILCTLSTPITRAWSKDRRSVHDTIINDLYSAARDVPYQGYAVVAGGLGGAGKTTVLGNHAGIDPAKYLMINPDDIKEELAQRGMVPEIDGLSPMEASDLVHEESSYLARQLALTSAA